MTYLVIAVLVAALIALSMYWGKRSAFLEKDREARRAERQQRRVAEWESVEEQFGGRHPDMPLTLDPATPATSASRRTGTGAAGED